MSLKELNDQRSKLVIDAREALDEIKSNTDEARAAELDARHDAIMAEFDKVGKTIEREQKQAAIEARAAELEDEARAAKRPGAKSEGEARGADEGKAPEYRKTFYKYLASGANLDELSGEERKVLRAGIHADGETRAQTTSAAAGGYTVPTELADQIIKSMAAWGPMYDENICTTITTSGGNAITIPTVNDVATAVAKHTEGTALTDDGGVDAEYGQRQLDAYVFDTEWIKFSFELAQDSIFNMEALLGELLGERLGRRANVELTTGDGTGDPNGVVTASTLGKTAAAIAALTFDEIIDLYHSVDPAYRMSPKARFMFNDSTLAAIRKLKDGDGSYIWSMGDVRRGEEGTVLGKPYSINQAMASLGTGNKTMLFGDFGKYFVRKVGAPVIGVKRESYWPDLGIAGYIRLDGELGDTAAVKHLIQA